MNSENFKKPKRSSRKPNSLDGFLHNSNQLDGSSHIRSKFSSSYTPTNGANLKSIDQVKPQREGFTSGNQSIEKVKIPNKVVGLDISLNDDKDKKNKRKKRDLKQKVKRVTAVSMAALILAVGSLFAYGYLKSRQIFRGDGEGALALQKDVDPSQLNGEGDGRVNILLLGKGGPGHEAPDLTDTLLLASIDPIQNEAALLSVPRDLYVKDANGYSSKINAIYSNAKQAKLAEGGDTDAAEEAGLRSVKQTVSEVLGIPIHYYTMVNFNAFERAINTVGGVTVDVKEPLYDSSMAWLNNGNPLLADKGLQSFDGKRALYYARSRYGSARGDFDRTERQKAILVALQQKVLSVGTFSNPFKVVELMNAFGDNVRTDLNGTGELKRLYEIGQSIGSDKISSVSLAEQPNMLVTTDNIDNQSVVVPVEGLYQYDDIHHYVRNTLRDAFLKQENARIVILNGTGTAGIATAKEKELKSYGYNIVSVNNAPTTNYQYTKLINLSGEDKRYTKSYLEKRLKVSSTNDYIEGIPTIETADFVVILGSDEAY